MTKHLVGGLPQYHYHYYSSGVTNFQKQSGLLAPVVIRTWKYQYWEWSRVVKRFERIKCCS